ncbi:MAG: tail fiber domain-containing protein, partial [Verrucomicrobiota bacterium]|nr:tail fiber domain-containing protein [Verrucomicrobiota bacterium]
VDATDGRFHMLDVMGHLEMNGFRANFENASEVRVPTPDQDNEATNKAYVDAAVATNATAIIAEASTARAAEQANATAITAEATTARAAEQANATAITALQSDVDQNESDADTAIADIKTGDTVFSGSPSFTGVKPLPSGQTNYTSNYYELRPEYTSSSDVPNYATVNVDGLLNADVINAEGMLRVGELYITGNEIGSNYGQVDINAIETYNLDVTGGMMFDGYRADFELAQEVRVPTPDQDNEATNKAYVDSAITAEAIARASAITTAVSGDINASSLTTSGAIITNNLNVGGSVTATEFITASDYRFKDNIKTITGAVDKVKQLRGVEYTLKSNGKDSVGVIAQEVEEVYPQLVSTSDELEGITDAKAVNYSSLIGVLIEAIKEQQTQIEDLKAQVNVLNESTNNQATNTILATFETQQ